MDMDQTFPRHGPDIASRVIRGEAVIVEPAEGRWSLLSEVGTRIWELSDGRHSLADIARAIVQEFEVEEEQARADLVEFVDDLAGRGLLQLPSGPY
jgi:hypothetical protein